MATARATKYRARADAAKRSSKARTSSASARRAPARTPPRKTRAASAAERRVAAAIVLVAFATAAWMLYPVMRIEYQQQRQKQTLEQRLAALQARNEELRKKAQRLQTPEGVEEVARESLGLTRPGEQVYIVTETEPTAAPAPDVTEQTRSIQATETSPITAILDLIFGVR
ncbi:MAG: septum formation initiator family protein [Coriobacteriia bacterium]|nr:septum formation initiator family protein [Coriobacteriia bacterium]